MTTPTKHTHSGTNLFGLLGIAFVVLKLTGYITWSWWWVTAPFWGGAVFAMTVVSVVLILAAVASRKPDR